MRSFPPLSLSTLLRAACTRHVCTRVAPPYVVRERRGAARSFHPLRMQRVNPLRLIYGPTDILVHPFAACARSNLRALLLR